MVNMTPEEKRALARVLDTFKKKGYTLIPEPKPPAEEVEIDDDMEGGEGS